MVARTGVVVRNAMLGGVWGEEECDGGVPFELNRAVNVELAVEADAYRVSVNGAEHVRFKHRAPPHLVSFVECTPDPRCLQVGYFDVRISIVYDYYVLLDSHSTALIIVVSLSPLLIDKTFTYNV